MLNLKQPSINGNGISDTRNFCIEDNIVKSLVECKGLISSNIGKLIHDVFNNNPDHIGLIDGEADVSFTFSQMKENSIRLALWLQKEGIGQGDIVAISTPRCLHLYSVICATMFVGAAYNPWQASLNLALARNNIRLIEPRVIITTNENVEVILEAARSENYPVKIIAIESSIGDIPSLQEVMQSFTSKEVSSFETIDPVDDNSRCTIFFSSGTTGPPKACVHTYRGIQKMMNFNPNEPQVIDLEYFYPEWSVSHIRIVKSILHRDTYVFHSKFEPRETCRIIKKYQVNRFDSDTYELRQLCTYQLGPEDDLSSVKTVAPSGSKMSLNVIKLTHQLFPNAFIRRMLGMTELGPETARTKACQNLDSEGFVSPGVQIKIVDLQTGKTLGFNEVGELYAKTQSMMLEYYKNPVKTKEFVDENGWAHTGDLACIDENGELVIKGRMKDCIRVRVKDVVPKDLEDILVTHPGVEDVVVVPVHHEMDYERPFAFVKIFPGAKVSEEEIINLSAPVHRLNEGFISFTQENLPRNINGKIFRNKLKDTANSIVYGH